MACFIIPIEGSGTKQDQFREKYIPALGVARAIVPFDDVAICWANVTAGQASAISANPDVVTIPPLDNTIALAATTSALEAIGIPAQWLQAGMTYRQVLRIVIAMAQFLQRAEGRGFKLGIAARKELTVSAVPLATRQAFLSAAADLGVDVSDITGSTTIRVALFRMGQRFAQTAKVGDL